MKIKNNIPNFITCGNLLCGCLAIVIAFNGNLVVAAYLIGVAAILDFLDGFVAHLLNVHSEIGKQLDSLADMVTFGIVPGTVLFLMLSKVTGDFPDWVPYIAFLIPIFSAIRLAIFNTDSRQRESFIGVPTPASAILICSLPLIEKFQPQIGSFNIIEYTTNPFFLIGITILLSYLMVANIPLFALKFKNFAWNDNKLRYTFLIISMILLILFQFIAIPFTLFLYVVVSVVNNKI